MRTAQIELHSAAADPRPPGSRYRKSLIRERGRHINRVAKTLELANIELSSVATDIMGKTGRLILQALIDGVEDPQALAQLAQGNLKKKRADLELAMTGRVTAHHRFLLAQQLQLIDDLARHIEALDVRIAECMRPFADPVTWSRLCQVSLDAPLR